MRRKDAQVIHFMKKTIILIPSRLSASRLPNKPLLKINNKSLINHVYEIFLQNILDYYSLMILFCIINH